MGIAFVLVAALFVLVGAASVRWMTWDAGTGVPSPGAQPATPSPVAWPAAFRAAWLPATAEALLLTLLAALWFGSLGHGGWVLLFLLLGALAGSADRWLRRRLEGAPGRAVLWYFLAALLKYLVAGGLCVWWLT